MRRRNEASAQLIETVVPRMGGAPSFRGLSLAERLERLTHPEPMSGCTLWIGGLIPAGYGMIWVDGRRIPAHRAAYELEVGPIPQGLELDHLCRNRACVNPRHLEPVTRAENQRRGMSPAGIAARKTRCLRGHALEGGNLYRSPDGHRHCRTCTQAAKRRHYMRRVVARLASPSLSSGEVGR